MAIHQPSHQYEVLQQASSAAEPIVLWSGSDSNEATMAFHEELRRLRTEGATGDVLVQRLDPGHRCLVRQPLYSADA
jgi:hypothetical protein